MKVKLGVRADNTYIIKLKITDVRFDLYSVIFSVSLLMT